MATVLCVVGPTATGKTKMGVALAKRFNGEVVSVDSMQIYRGMAVGTAAPTAEEMEGIPHHMVGVADPAESWSAARYVQAADAAVTLEELAQKLALGRADPEGARDGLLHTMACKSAIKAGMTTDATELAALVEKVQSGEILYCPHGRPVKYQLSKYDIEKMFKRA